MSSNKQNPSQPALNEENVTKPPALRIETVCLDRLKLDPRNCRAHGERNSMAVQNSLRRFGQQKPVVIDADNVVIAGNATVAAARQLGWTSIAAVRTSLQGPDKTAYAITDNRSGELASWDIDNLEAALAALEGDLRAVCDISDAELEQLSALPELESLGGGIVAAEDGTGSLSESFGVPPFSVLDARQGWWQRRKQAWLSLGLQSELGRGNNVLDLSATAAGFGFKRGDRPGLMMHGQASLNRIARRGTAIPGGGAGAHSAWLGSDSRPICETGMSGTSIFDPVLAELAYRWFCPPGGMVLDPFAGGSVRGIVASRLIRRYTGIDLRPEQVQANIDQARKICQRGLQPEWITGDSRNVAALAPGEYDFLFSCPPYGNLEIYSDDPADLSNADWPVFREAYRSIISASAKLLRPDRFACFVVANFRRADGGYNDLVSETCRAFEAAGLLFYNEAILVTMIGSLPLRVRAQFEGSRKLGKTHQNVLVFVKGDPRAATEACGPCEFGSLEETPLPGEPVGEG